MQFEGKPEYPGVTCLSEIDSNLVNYSWKIVRMLYLHAGLKGLSTPRILDFGAGAGSLTDIWHELTGLKPDCVELDPNLRLLLRQKGFNAVSSASELIGKYDFIYSSNVLEHIPNDQAVLDDLSTLLTPKGRIGIYVPAFQILYTRFDYSIGHLRRYRKKQLANKMKNSNLKILHSSYSDSIGFFSVLILKILGFNFSEGLTRLRLIKIYDNYLLSISNLFDFLGLRFILGKNILAVAEKHKSQLETTTYDHL